jgi:SAM-dependent methyltransferase
VPRLDVRCNARLPVTLIIATQNGASPYQVVTSNVGLGGAFLDSPLPLPEQSGVKLRALLPDYSEFETTGRILRKEGTGVAVEFLNMNRPARSTLWEYIRSTLPREKACPYCGKDNLIRADRCSNCGLSINFQSSLYLDLHERELTERWLRFMDSAADELVEKMEAAERAIERGGEDQEGTYRHLEGALEDFLRKAERFESAVVDDKTIKAARLKFRERTNRILSKGYLPNRTRVWPQGHQGDYKTLESLYRNIPLSEGIGRYLDLLFLNMPLGVAVRNRIRKLEEILRAELGRRRRPSVLNIACGSCRELVGLAPEIKVSEARVTCIDTDDDALAFAHNRLSYTGVLQQIEFRNYNALRLFDDDLNLREFGRKDVIYSLGLFDYLASDFLVKMLGALYRLLNPGGTMIAAFKDAGRYKSQTYHWLVDWDAFLQRGENDFRGIFSRAGIPRASISELREETGVIVFYLINR